MIILWQFGLTLRTRITIFVEILSMKILPFLFVCVLAIQGLFAQDSVRFTSSISIDSILLGNIVEVRFTLENADMKSFYAPKFEGFEVVSGPNASNSMQIINGEVSRSMTYSYHIKPMEVGDYFIPPASIATEIDFLESEPIAVLVVPNPDGIIQSPQNEGASAFGEGFFGRNPFDDPFFKRAPLEHPLFRSRLDSLPPQQQKRTTKKKRKITRI